MYPPEEFMTAKEQKLTERFLRDGYIITDVESPKDLQRIQSFIAGLAAGYLGVKKPDNAKEFLDTIHHQLDYNDINNLRLHVIAGMNAESWIRPAYYRLAKEMIKLVVGNELSMQRKINLSIQMPDDTSSVLPVHADVWSGDSPYEIVLWVPYVDVFKTKAMFLLPPEANARHCKNFADSMMNSAEQLMEKITPDAKWIDMAYGKCMLFTQNLMHGNILNVEATTRWSSNCRFKSIFSPYSDKRLGEFFEPITVKPATILGANYTLPQMKGAFGVEGE